MAVANEGCCIELSNEDKVAIHDLLRQGKDLEIVKLIRRRKSDVSLKTAFGYVAYLKVRSSTDLALWRLIK